MWGVLHQAGSVAACGFSFVSRSSSDLARGGGGEGKAGGGVLDARAIVRAAARYWRTELVHMHWGKCATKIFRVIWAKSKSVFLPVFRANLTVLGVLAGSAGE
jgi:hypothetical protein